MATTPSAGHSGIVALHILKAWLQVCAVWQGSQQLYLRWRRRKVEGDAHLWLRQEIRAVTRCHDLIAIIASASPCTSFADLFSHYTDPRIQ